MADNAPRRPAAETSDFRLNAPVGLRCPAPLPLLSGRPRVVAFLKEITMSIFLASRLRSRAVSTVSLISLLALSALTAACQPSVPTADDARPAKATTDAAPATSEARYICPMHPHIQQHGPGTCPICAMTLVRKEIPVVAVTPDGASGPSAKPDRKVLYWYDPMRPEVKFDAPGQSPFMDMALVPKYGEGGTEAQAGIRIDATVVQNLGIRTALPVRRDVRASVRVPARVVADARGQARLQARVEGWIEKLHVRVVGQQVLAGSVVAEIYSPELMQAQEELLLGPDAAIGAAERLRRLGIADADIQAIRQAGKALRRLPLRAPVSGVVTELNVREGSRVSPDSVLIDLAPRSAVWVEALLFPGQKLRLGNELRARFSLPDFPERSWQASGGVAVPVADAVTQTIAVRFALDNQGELPLGVVLDAEITGATKSGVLMVPASAVIRTAQGARVLVEREPGRFVPTTVVLGLRDGDQLEVREGLSASHRIVVSGQFLLDAEASLQAGFSQMTPASTAAPATSGPDHD